MTLTAEGRHHGTREEWKKRQLQGFSDQALDAVRVPVESMGICMATKSLRNVIYIPKDVSLLDFILDDLDEKNIRRVSRSHKDKFKKIVIITKISHMLLNKKQEIITAKPTLLANGFCSTCWDAGYGGQLPLNLATPTGEIRW